MKAGKFLMAGIAGTIAFFISGWVIYGMLVDDYMKKHPGLATGVSRGDDEMQIGYIILSNLALGFLFAMIYQWASIRSLMRGLISGVLIGFLMACNIDFIFYGTTYIMSLHSIAADIPAFTVMCAIGGAVVGWVLGMNKKNPA